MACAAGARRGTRFSRAARAAIEPRAARPSRASAGDIATRRVARRTTPAARAATRLSQRSAQRRVVNRTAPRTPEKSESLGEDETALVHVGIDRGKDAHPHATTAAEATLVTLVDRPPAGQASVSRSLIPKNSARRRDSSRVRISASHACCARALTKWRRFSFSASRTNRCTWRFEVD